MKMKRLFTLMSLFVSIFTNCGGQNFRSVNAADFEQAIKQPNVEFSIPAPRRNTPTVTSATP